MARWWTMKYLLLTFLMVTSAFAAEAPKAPAQKIIRTWSSSDGKTLQGELLEFSDTEIKVKLSTNFQIVKIPLDRLAEADRTFIMEMVKKKSLDHSLTHGPYAAQITGQFVKGTSKQGLLYQIQGDPKWDGTQRYPLLIWLHGAGQSGNDNEAQMAGAPKQWFTPEAQAKHPCIVITPQCPSREIGWKNEVAMNLMALIADVAEKLPVDKDRIYLTGSSMGGSGTWTMISQWPDVFACAVPLCGGGDPKKADVMKSVPIWVFHGDKDDQVPVDRSRTMFAALQAVSGNIKYSELPGEGHLITKVVYDKPELHEWIFQQRRGVK
jgi:predicted esterase